LSEAESGDELDRVKRKFQATSGFLNNVDSAKFIYNDPKEGCNTMSMMISEVYDALKEAGASEEKARAAASAIADFKSEVMGITSTQKLHGWMLGFNLAFTMAVMWRVFS